MTNLQSLRSELGLKITKLDADDLRLPLVGEILNSIDTMVEALDEAGAGALSEAAGGVWKLLEAIVMENLPAEDGLNRVAALYDALDQALETEIVTGAVPEGELRAAMAASLDGTSMAPPSTAGLQATGYGLQATEEARNVSPVARSPKPEARSEAVVQQISPELFDDCLLAEALGEARECLENAEQNLLLLEQDVGDHSLIDGIFRPIHTLKGTAGFLEWATINTVCHRAEDILVKLRDGKMLPTPAIVDCMLAVVDVVGRLLGQIEDLARQHQGQQVEIVPVTVGPVLRRLDQIAAGDAADAEHEAVEGPSPQQNDIEKKQDSPGQVENGGKPQTGPAAKTILGDVVKVPADKLDEFSELVGEMVVAVSVLAQHKFLRGSADRDLLERLDQMEKTTERLRERVLDIRMFPIGSVFTKLVRQVRDVARKSGKDVRLETSGEETLLDKTVIDQIFAPLTHVVRNAVDHGLEAAEQRRAAGKPEQGTIHLSAHHLGDNVVIELTDDGRGLDSEKIRAKAVEMGLMKPDAPVTEEVINAVIFRPGVSTAEKVTDISGRGVGLDVVKKTVDKLRGKIAVRSQPGKGTTFSLKLPLTTSIIEGLVIHVGSSRFILPILSVNQTVRPRPEDLQSIHDRPGMFFLLHGQLVPILRLYDFYGIETDQTDPSQGLVVVIKNERGLHGILVDELSHRQQVVIKNLGDDYADIAGVTGGTILGDGRVGLILDPEEIVRVWSHTSGDEKGEQRDVQVLQEQLEQAS